MLNRACPACSADISAMHKNAIYCSNACRRWVANGHTEARRHAVAGCLTCGGSLCGKVVTALYCSRPCKSAAVESRRDRDDASRYLRERERRIAYARSYARANPHVGQAAKRRRRARVNAGGIFQFTSRDWLRMQRRHGGRCVYCGAVGALTMDHVVPIIRGGTHSVGNIVPACMTCNVHKQARFVTEWKYGKSRRVS